VQAGIHEGGRKDEVDVVMGNLGQLMSILSKIKVRSPHQCHVPRITGKMATFAAYIDRLN
jgi:hypothetical protein